MTDELKQYKKELRKRLAPLEDVFARALLGDYSKDLPLPEVDDEIAPVFVGVTVMLSSMREQITEYEQLNAQLEEKVAERTKHIEEQNKILAQRLKELQILNNAMVGREMKMIELKKQIKALQKQAD